jgi:outer membrane receptor for ferrienterochelin and colicins
MKTVLGVLLLVTFGAAAAAQAPASTPLASAAEGDDLAGLMAILSEETEVATRTRMNGDFVPGIVTVLHGEELEALGIETVGEALGLVPGLQSVRDTDGTPSVVVRGIDFPFNSGNVKVLINGVPLSRESAGINGVLLQTPVSQVERIEVIRGPGSVVYGDFAFMGLVNVITRTRGARAFLRGGSDDTFSGGGHVFRKAGGWDIGLSAAGSTSDDAPIAAPRVAKEERAFASFLLRRGEVSLTAQGITRDLQQTNAPVGNAPLARNEQTHWTFEARHDRDWSPSLHSQLRASFLENSFESAGNEFRGDVASVALDLSWQGWRRHSWLFAAGLSNADIEFAEQRRGPPPTPPGGRPLPAPPPLTIRNQHRNIASVALQDRFDVSDAVSVTAGGRFDRYSDVDQRFTPRLSLVFRASDHHILKLQHAEGFRGPTFFELYAPGTALPDLGFEVNATSELNYVHRRPKTVARATVFRAQIKDMIFTAGAGRFDNSRKAKAVGAELEWEQQIAARLKLLANVSYVDAEHNRGPTRATLPTQPSADWLANFVALWRPTARTLLTGRLNHVGDRHATSDPRGYDVLDFGITRHDVFVRGLQARAGVKNAFDREVRYVLARPDGTDAAITFPGRTFWVQVSWSGGR